MAVIAQRQLRNDVSAVLRRVEQGETFTITVNGRPVAELGPLTAGSRASQPLDAVLALTPVDGDWSSQVLAAREEEHAGEATA